MSKSQEHLNKQYQSVCQQLGDAHLKLQQLKDHIASLEKEAELLNKLYPHLQQLELELKKDLSDEKEKLADQA